MRASYASAHKFVILVRANDEVIMFRLTGSFFFPDWVASDIYVCVDYIFDWVELFDTCRKRHEIRFPAVRIHSASLRDGPLDRS